jgi:deoxyhypusine synthase
VSDITAKELHLLDLNQCHSVADIVAAMSRCSFGARMLGEVTEKIYSWIVAGMPPLTIYEGELDSLLGRLLQDMVGRKWLRKIVSLQEYIEQIDSQENIIVIGAYSERYNRVLYSQPKEAIYINIFGLANPQQISDGYFYNLVFSDPRFVIPVIFTVLEERLNNRPTRVTQFVDKLSQYGGVAQEISNGANTLLSMIEDPDCTVFMTLSGAMTIAKMGLIICDMIDWEMVQGICSTGALMAHGLVESVGLKHYKYNPSDGDAYLAQMKVNRVTDTLEPEKNLDHIELIIRKVLWEFEPQSTFSSRIFHQQVGRYLAQEYPGQRGILKSAYEKNVPVIVPAFIDSEIGNDVYIHNQVRQSKGAGKLIFDMEKDTEFLLNMVINSEKIGIFTIGGGVPRNYVQNIAPLIDIINDRQVGELPEKKFVYGCRICPEPMYYGNLSGCTYSEGMSWRKMDQNGLFSEINADATQVWPFLIKYVREKTLSILGRHD